MSGSTAALEVVGGARRTAAHPFVQVLHRQADDAVLCIACRPTQEHSLL